MMKNQEILIQHLEQWVVHAAKATDMFASFTDGNIPYLRMKTGFPLRIDFKPMRSRSRSRAYFDPIVSVAHWGKHLYKLDDTVLKSKWRRILKEGNWIEHRGIFFTSDVAKLNLELRASLKRYLEYFRVEVNFGEHDHDLGIIGLMLNNMLSSKMIFKSQADEIKDFLEKHNSKRYFLGPSYTLSHSDPIVISKSPQQNVNLEHLTDLHNLCAYLKTVKKRHRINFGVFY